MNEYAKFTDAELVARCLEEDHDAWATLVYRYQRLIASITRKFRLGADDAADVYQSVNLALFQQLNSLRSHQKLSSWIITVTVRECWKLRERARRTGSLDEPDAPDPSSDAHLLLEENIQLLEQQHLLRRAVALLPDKCRTLIEVLFFRESPNSYEEISRQLAMPVASIGPTRGRCLEKLKKNLEKIDFF
ncbi:MAG: sigma-70 family RNA polymerase sigma factor [Blastocatellia bacterium]|nr:sigma-70 family RNA polymerase sigma factor [Blastocatellia bacterium]